MFNPIIFFSYTHVVGGCFDNSIQVSLDGGALRFLHPSFTHHIHHFDPIPLVFL